MATTRKHLSGQLEAADYVALIANPCRRCGETKCANGIVVVEDQNGEVQMGLDIGAAQCPRPGSTPEYERMMDNARKAAAYEAAR